MSDKISTGELIDMVYAHSEGFTKADIKSVVTAFLGTVIDAFRNGSNVELRGIGSFKIKERAARTVKSHLDGKVHKVPPRKGVSFKVSNTLKADLNK